jgi:hypothetical protein
MPDPAAVADSLSGHGLAAEFRDWLVRLGKAVLNKRELAEARLGAAIMLAQNGCENLANCG